jgi:hypothetical protein
VVVFAEVYSVETGYAPIQEWTSTNAGASFSEVNGLKSVAAGFGSADTSSIGAVVVPGANSRGVGFVTADSAPTFDEFPFSSPPTCAIGDCPAGEHFATLQPGEEHLLGNEPSVDASQLGANAGVLGVYDILGPSGCTFGTDYTYASGEQSATNNYDISPDSTNSAWKVALSQADCEVDDPAVGGGPSGFGVVEDDLKSNLTIYHRFDPTTDKFDTPRVTIEHETEKQASVSQDGSGNVYATYIGSAPAIRFAYSSTAGASWLAPETINADTDQTASNLSSAVGSDGHGWATWEDQNSVYAQPFEATTAVTQTTSVEATNVTLAAPSQCVKNGIVKGTLTFKLSSHKRKGSVVVKIYKVTFSVGSTHLTITRKKLSNAPYTAVLHVKNLVAGHRYELKVRAFIAVHHGPARSKTLHVLLTACA